MFLFSCCTEAPNDNPFELRSRKQQQQQYTIIPLQQKFSKKYIHSQHQVLKVKKSQYFQLINLYKNSNELWEDSQFPHNNDSLGKLQGVNVTGWKRLSNIVKSSVLFDGNIQPQDAIQGLLGDCYFLSAISALAERESRIKAIFGEQSGIKNGIFRVVLRINGIVKQILVDDYVPVNSQGQPVFCQPNKNEIWVPILQKAWAKANGSYGNIIAGTPTQIFRAMTYAPAQAIETGDSAEEIQFLWRKILENAKLDRPCCCGTDDNPDIKWERIGLVPGHAYTLIDAAQLQSSQGNRIRMLKLRNPWGNTEWEGEGCENDSKFWGSIVNSETKSNFLKDWSINNDGIFYIRFRDYCKYFSQTHICHLQEQGNYIYQNYEPHRKRGFYWTLTIFESGQYWLQTHQADIRSNDSDESTLARITMMIFRKGTCLELIDGILGHYQSDCSLKLALSPGQYTIFTKFDSNQKQRHPYQASVSVYSHNYVFLDKADQIKQKNTLRDCMLDQAKTTKRKKFEDQTMWISWKLLYKQGGYAYICFGAEKQAQFKWNVSFNQSEFENTHFRMKKPWKRKGDNQSFEVLPGNEKIIVVRVKNDTPNTLKWPPKISYKLEHIK